MNAVFPTGRWLCFTAALCLSAPFAVAQRGELRFGDVSMNGDTVAVPITLAATEGAGVSAMDFRLRYDPEVFEPVSVDSGSAASAAGKQVRGNVVSPGEYVVLMFGLNQQSLSAGDVAHVTMRVKQPPDSGRANLRLANVTLSLPNATDLPSSGGTHTLRFPESDDGEDDASPGDDESDGDAQDDPLEGDTADTDQSPEPIATVDAPGAADSPGDTTNPSDTARPPRNVDGEDGAADTEAPDDSEDALARANTLRASLPRGGIDDTDSGGEDKTDSATAGAPEPPGPRGSDKQPKAGAASPSQGHEGEERRKTGAAPEDPGNSDETSRDTAERIKTLSAAGIGAVVFVVVLVLRRWLFP